MTSPFVAEIRIFPLKFAPIGWAFCNGQLLPISQNTALFSLLGTTYGGNGTSNFALPNMQGRAPMAPGQGPSLSLHDLGEEGGATTVSLLQTEIPAHSHNVMADVLDGTAPSPGPNLCFAKAPTGTPYSNVTTSQVVQFNVNAISSAGGSQPHNNLMPYLTLNFCIALQGVYPPRS